MVAESIVAYLETAAKEVKIDDAKLRELVAYDADNPYLSLEQRKALIAAVGRVTILDPAVGSGAFPMGCLHRLTHILQRLDKDGGLWMSEQQNQIDSLDLAEVRAAAQARFDEAIQRDGGDYVRKLYLIERSLFGVDIQPIAVQIAKLRFFISLVVEQKLDSIDPSRAVQPLPNLETKIVAANTLIRPAGGQLKLDSDVSRKLEKELSEVRRRHFSARKWSEKKKQRDRDAELRAALAAELTAIGMDPVAADQMAAWNPYDQNQFAPFFDAEWMFGPALKDGFDIVIGNPPYIKEHTLRTAFDGLRSSAYYQGKMDIWYFFGSIALDNLLPTTGILCFIATNNWITNDGASKFRDKMLQEAQILKFLDFGDFKIFENASIQTMILLARKSPVPARYAVDSRKIVNPRADWNAVTHLLKRSADDYNEYVTARLDRSKLKGRYFSFSSNSNEDVLVKISDMSNFSLLSSEVASGIDVLQDTVSKSSASVLGSNAIIGDGIFVVTDDEKRSLGIGPNEMRLLRPYYLPRQIGRHYSQVQNSHWLIYTDSSFKDKSKMRAYPRIKAHLDKFAAIMTSVNAPYGLHRSRNERFFQGEKILSLRKCVVPTFCFTDYSCYVARSFTIIKTTRMNLRVLTGILNSKLIVFWLSNRGKLQGALFQIDKEPLLALPLINPIAKLAQPIERVMGSIIRAKSENFSADTSPLEREIDQLVYQLYGLDEADIAVIEGTTIKGTEVSE